MAVGVALLLSGCVPPVPEPVVTPTLAPGDAAVLAAREALGEPVVSVAAQVVGMWDRVHEVRHEVPRGVPQGAAVDDLRGDLDALQAQAEALRDTAAGLDRADADDRVADATAAATALADLAVDVVEAARTDLDALDPLVAVDAEMDQVVASWDERGSRSQREAAFAELVGVADELLRRVRRLDVPSCTVLRTDRIRWAERIAVRTSELHVAVSGREGTRFDELRERYAQAPYGEDRRIADAESAACWAATVDFTEQAEQADALVEVVRTALDG